jgi:archaemetzincin
MNGINHLGELDSRPLHLCPVDLRKLYDSIQFDPVARYAHLRDFYHDAGFEDEAAWSDRQLSQLAGSTVPR